jgi:metal-responsive CopG/Arc/MetJ family transcriptional regulator
VPIDKYKSTTKRYDVTIKDALEMARRITFTVNDHLFAELERLSMEDGRSLSNLVAFGIEMYVVQRLDAEKTQIRATMRSVPRR